MRLPFLLTTLLLFGLLTSCHTMKKNTKSDDKNMVKLTDTYWKLLDINGEAIPEKLNKVPFIQLEEKDKRVFGTNSCNTFFGTYDLNKNEILFGQMAGTLMACLDNDIESKLNQLMSSVVQYTINDKILVLQNTKENITARFIEIENADLNGTWTLNSLSTSKASLNQLFPDKKPHIIFDINKEKLSGNGGCNQIHAQLKTSGNNINLGPIGSSRMACPSESEAIFLKALTSVTRFNLSKDKKTLTLFRGDLLIMRFERKN